MSSKKQQSLSPSPESKVILENAMYKPQIRGELRFVLPSHEWTISQSANEIFQQLRKQRLMFLRADEIVELVRNRLKECLDIVAVKPDRFPSAIEVLGLILKWTKPKNKWVLSPSHCSEALAKQLLAASAAREILDTISMIVKCPIIVQGKDGKIRILSRGYHAFGGGIVVTQGIEPPDVPLVEAIDSLLELLCDFQFETPSDIKRALAMMLTPALLWGGFLKDACIPLFLVEANDSQAGKGYLLHLLAAIYGETLIPRAPRKGGVGSFDEDFSSALFKGHPLIMFDNLRDQLDSPHIESFLTARGSFSVRTPHRAAVDIDVRNYILMATSNNFKTTTDLENRLLRLRILKRPSSHRFKSFGGKDVLPYVQEHQSYYLGCVFSVVRHWIENGRPRTKEARHSFREWAQTLDWILQNVFKDKVGGRLMDTAQISSHEGLAAALGLGDLDSLPREED